MRISRKLTYSFIGIAFLLGIVGYISFVKNEKMKLRLDKISESSIAETINSAETSLTLEQIQTKLQKLLVERYQSIVQPSTISKNITQFHQTITRDLVKVEKHLELSKRATVRGIQLAKTELNEKKAEEEELEELEAIATAFEQHKKNISQYFELLNSNPDAAAKFFETKLEPFFRAELMSLVLKYTRDAEGELVSEAGEIQSAIAQDNKLILFSNVLAFFSAIYLGWLTSRSIAKPLIHLTQAASEVSAGKVSTRVYINSQNEIGVLAKTFNQMLDDLDATTVSKAYVNNIIELMANGLVVLNSRGVITRVNQAAANILAAPENEFIGRHIEELFAGEEQVIKLITQKQIENLETDWRTKNGSKKQINFSSTVMYDERGNIQAIVCVVQDITESKRTQERLAKINECFLSFSTDPLENINRLTALCGQLLAADGALYSRLEKDQLNLVGKWQIPSEYKFEADLRESICYQVMQQGYEQSCVISNLQNTQYAVTNSKIVFYGVSTYVGQAVKCKTDLVGAVCALYKQDFVPTEADQKILGIIAAAIGVEEERRSTQAALRESEERYALATRGANDGLWDWNLKTNEIYFSTRWKTMLGYEEHQIGNTAQAWFDLVHPHDIDRLKAAIASHLQGQTPHLEHEHRMLHKDGSYRWMLSRGLAVRDRDRQPHRLAGSQADITASKATEAELLHEVFHDALTGLPNRVFFMERLSDRIQRIQSDHDDAFAVLFLDIDRFKVVNDSLGHFIGDQLLVAIARRLEACVRPEDTVARLGGDEFTILLENIRNLDDATQIAERIQQALVLPFKLERQEVFTSASIGIACGSPDYEKAEDLLRDADTTMYRAKGAGKARYAVFDRSMHTQAIALLQIETTLRRAVERKEFVLHYQPIVNLKTGALVGFEALIRLWHPTRGLISPGEFIAVAEETGLIIPIGLWVLREACGQMYRWNQKFACQPRLTISVNISAKQFCQPDLVAQIKQILQETQLDGRYLRLEITETALVENADAVAIMLRELQALGIGLSIDDFGTGYSSLSYLHRFAIDTLKIDKSFISNINTDWEKNKIVNTVVTLAENLAIDVVAEGVETPDQVIKLQETDCKYAQGFLFSCPLDSQATEALIVAKLQHLWV